MSSLEGRQLGNYDVIRRIRAGGMGAVYEGRQRTAFDRRVAIKVILGNYATDPDMRRRFAREAKTIARLHHPHILPLIEFGDEQGVLYLVMPFIEDGTLTNYLRRHLPDVHEVSTIFVQMLDAVEYAHDEGLIHRDIKSSNVLLEARRAGPPYAYLADFGLVRTIQQLESSYAGTPIPLDQVPGTPQYMAPEQTRGIVTTATDIYALGVLLYQMLTGELPYRDSDDVKVIKMHLYSPVPNPCELDASIPVELGAVVAHAMAKRPEQRFANIAAFRAAFLAAIDEPVEHVEDRAFSDENVKDFEVHELPQRPAPPPKASLQPSQQLRMPPEAIEFKGSAQASARRPRASSKRNETALFPAGARRPHTTGENPDLPLQKPSARHPRNTEDFPKAHLPPVRARRSHATDEAQENILADASPIATARQRAKISPLPPTMLRPSSSARQTQSHKHRFALLVGIAVPVLLILLLIVPRVFGLTIFPAGFPILGAPPVATISLTVRTQTVQDTFLLVASPQTQQPDVDKRLIPDRNVTSNASASSAVPATGQQSTPGTKATGTLFFQNNGQKEAHFSSGSPFSSSSGVQVQLDKAVTVLAHSTTSGQATAKEVGQAGNLAPNSISYNNEQVTVTNPQAFSGGSDPSTVHVVAQSDLDNVKNALTSSLQTTAQQKISNEIQSDEMQVGTPTYSTSVTSDHQVGDQTAQVTVTVTVTATVLTYNVRTARDLAQQLLNREAMQSLGTSYHSTGHIMTTGPTIEQQGDNGRLELKISLNCLWAYTVTSQTEEQWRQVIKGASIALAQSYLSTRPGITKAQIQLPFNTNTLPMNDAQIVFVVLQ
jgi:serine/threonine protein kinase